MTDDRRDLPCAVVRDLLPLYHDGVVSDETGKIIESHLNGCEGCRNELDEIGNEERVAGDLMSRDESTSFQEFRDGVGRIRRSGTVRGIMMAALAMLVFIGGIVFLNNACVFKADPDRMQIEDVCRYDLGVDGGEGIFFTIDMNSSGSWSVIPKQSSSGDELDIVIRKTLLGYIPGKDRILRTDITIDSHSEGWAEEIRNAKAIKVNGKVIWTSEDGLDTDPPEYVRELVRSEQDHSWNSDPATTISTTMIDQNFISITYEDGHGVRWDKDGNVIATFRVDDNGQIISLDETPDQSAKSAGN